MDKVNHFLSESALWQTESEFVDPTGNKFCGSGETRIEFSGGGFVIKSWVQLGEMKRENNYSARKISQNRYQFESLNPELGIQKGYFDINKNYVFSKFVVEGTSLSGFEIMKREDDVCNCSGALYNGDELINTWTAKMKMYS